MDLEKLKEITDLCDELKRENRALDDIRSEQSILMEVKRTGSLKSLYIKPTVEIIEAIQKELDRKENKIKRLWREAKKL